MDRNRYNAWRREKRTRARWEKRKDWPSIKKLKDARWGEIPIVEGLDMMRELIIDLHQRMEKHGDS